MSEQDPGIELHEIEAAHKVLDEGDFVHDEPEVSIGTKWFPEFEATINDQSKKIIVITGTTSGTGMIATKTALRKGATVYCLNRNVEKARSSLSSFLEQHPQTKSKCYFIKCDLQDFRTVESACEELTEALGETGFDVLVNNAGVMALEDKATKDGYDVQMQTNHLSHFMLTRLLYPLLKQRSSDTGEARVVNHTSMLRLWPPTHLHSKYFERNGGNLGGDGANPNTGGRWRRYHQSKLANSCFTVELQKRLDHSKVNMLSLCAHPGVASTSLFTTTKSAGGVKNLNTLKNGQSQEDGTMGLLKCMFHNDVRGGGLYGPKGMAGKPRKLWHGVLTTSAGGKLLWKESEKACGAFKI